MILDKLGASPAQPDAMVGVLALLRSEIGVVARTTRRGSAVGFASVDSYGRAGVRSTGRHTVAGIRAVKAYPTVQGVHGSF
jgi:hypothetical protein